MRLAGGNKRLHFDGKSLWAEQAFAKGSPPSIRQAAENLSGPVGKKAGRIGPAGSGFPPRKSPGPLKGRRLSRLVGGQWRR
ncbi:hypothetical protein B4135_0844 [Caldibacillus debilis]|uniref:Uncharacterized protein n=1 Tax=Caldibacillus debilis TaxID=301148 RepID=A0A150M6B2_9BACI|nr:hypothetical protein B4135_0844 [Caldibacillus debilis]